MSSTPAGFPAFGAPAPQPMESPPPIVRPVAPAPGPAPAPSSVPTGYGGAKTSGAVATIPAGYGDAKPSRQSRYLSVGRFGARVKKLVLQVNRKGLTNFIAELEITSSSDPNAHTVGETVSWLKRLNDDMGMVKTKSFQAALFGVAPEDPRMAGAESIRGLQWMTGERNPFEGTCVEVNSTPVYKKDGSGIMTSKEGEAITNQTWRVIEYAPKLQAELAELAKASPA